MWYLPFYKGGVTVDWSLPDDFDYVDFGELLEVIEGMLEFSRAGTFDEEDGEREVVERAQTILRRYRAADCAMSPIAVSRPE